MTIWRFDLGFLPIQRREPIFLLIRQTFDIFALARTPRALDFRVFLLKGQFPEIQGESSASLSILEWTRLYIHYLLCTSPGFEDWTMCWDESVVSPLLLLFFVDAFRVSLGLVDRERKKSELKWKDRLWFKKTKAKIFMLSSPVRFNFERIRGDSSWRFPFFKGLTSANVRSGRVVSSSADTRGPGRKSFIMVPMCHPFDLVILALLGHCCSKADP